MKNNKKGFTLAELLIVVAIIAVLVAIAIPVFNAQKDRANAAVDAANIRALYAETMAEYVSASKTGDYLSTSNSGTKTVTCIGSSTNLTDATTIGGQTGISWSAGTYHIKVTNNGQSWALEAE